MHETPGQTRGAFEELEIYEGTLNTWSTRRQKYSRSAFILFRRFCNFMVVFLHNMSLVFLVNVSALLVFNEKGDVSDAIHVFVVLTVCLSVLFALIYYVRIVISGIPIPSILDKQAYFHDAGPISPFVFVELVGYFIVCVTAVEILDTFLNGCDSEGQLCRLIEKTFNQFNHGNRTLHNE